MGPSSRRTILNNTHLTAEPFKFSPAEPVDYGKNVYRKNLTLPRPNERVFNTPTGKPLVRVIETIDKAGNIKYTNNDSVGKEFSKLIKNLDLKTEKGVGFYTLRRTAATLTARSGEVPHRR